MHNENRVLRFLDVGHHSLEGPSRILSEYMSEAKCPITPVVITEDELKQSPEKKWILECQAYSYPIEDQISALSPFVQEELANGNGTLLFSNMMEGDAEFACGIMHDIYWKVWGKYNNFIYVVGSLNIHEAVVRHKKDEKIHEDFNIIPVVCCSFEANYQSDYEQTGDIDPTKYKNREKMFLCLNRVLRPQRIVIVGELHDRDLLKHGYVSLFLQDGYSNIMEIQQAHYIGVDDLSMIRHGEALKIVKKIAPLIVDVDTGVENLANNLATEQHLNSYFSLVTATQFFSQLDNCEDTVQFNEKPLKPIFHKQPFIIAGCYQYLHNMKEYGYKSFSPWIDESYDDIEDDFSRITAILDEVERLCAISKADWDIMIEEMVPVLEHNHNLYKNWKEHQFSYKYGLNLLYPYTVSAE